MKRAIAFGLVVVLFVFAAWLISCQSGDDDDEDTYSGDDDDSTWDPDPECDPTIRPQLLGLSLRVNGVLVEMPADVKVTDELIVEMEYADEDCNLEGGRVLITIDPEEPSLFSLDELIRYYYDIGSDVGCSSEESGPYPIALDPNDYIIPDDLERIYPLHFKMRDICKNSDPFWLPLDFTVVTD